MRSLLYQPGHKDALFAFISERKLMKKTHPCVEADIEECTHFEYPGDAFHTFWTLTVIYLALNGTVTSGFHPKYLKLCSEEKRSFYGSGTTWGKWLITKFSFWGEVSFKGCHTFSFWICMRSVSTVRLASLTEGERFQSQTDTVSW